MVPTELKVLALGAVLLLVHIFAAGHFKTKQYGLEWNMGPRDGAPPPLNAVAGRMVRAQANFLETLPIAIIALLGVVVAGRTNSTSAIGAWVWLAARVVYLPLYGYGVPKIRTVVYLLSLIGLGMVIWPLLIG
ncbi:MAPEG family protein [Novosphingobium sp.]|uniref:MAPEG family protein n=1 Tax=Novosphingobium sp. TaxID=1874826 RepID=UPI003D0E4B9E